MLIAVLLFLIALFVAYANACGREADLHYGGLSTVAGPDGERLGRSGRRSDLLTVRLPPIRAQK